MKNKYTNLFIILLSFLILWMSLKNFFDVNIFNEGLLIDNYFTYIVILLFGVFSRIENKENKKMIPVNILLIVLSTFIGNIIGFNYIFQGIVFSLVSMVLLILVLNNYKIINLNLNINLGFILIIGYVFSSGSILHGFLIGVLYYLGYFISGFIKKNKIFKFINLIFIISLLFLMFNRVLFTFKNDKCVDFINITHSIINSEYQYINIDLKELIESDIIVQKGLPLELIINVEKYDLLHYQNRIVIEEYDINQKLKVGKNVIKFTPEAEKTINYSTWMNMIKSKIKIIDDTSCFINEEAVCRKEC